MNEKKIPAIDILMEKIQKTINNAWNIGNHIHQPSIDRWLDNFTGEALCNTELKITEAAKREQQLALFLLCNFVYYNENEIKHLVRKMLDRYVHTVFISENRDIITDDDFDKLIKKTQFTFLGNISESSSYLLYHFRQENDLSKQCFIDKDTTENIVFIDDFSITGSQAYCYVRNKINSKGWETNKKIYILLMIATDNAIKELEQINGVTVLPCIVLDDKSKAFSDSSIVFAGYDARDKNDARKMCEHYGTKIITSNSNMTSLGFGEGGYLFGAYYNIPDNILPIFWSSHNDWNYLFKRYDKKYGVSGTSLGGRYV
jgi:hypothetical protein